MSAFELFRIPVFARIIASSALVLGSHALHDTFSVIRWVEAGISPKIAGLLWSLAVGAEVIVFFLVGPWLIDRIGSGRAIATAAIVGAIRWIVSALTVDVGIIALIQPLHGITFAVLHLACLRLLAVHVPSNLAATAQALYGTVGVGLASALVTLASGWMYAAMGSLAFFLMSGLCLAALPIALSLRDAGLGAKASC
jgi:PPP family 3-phenylpropionic acid transporter